MEEAFMQRTATCGELRASDAGRTVILNGWVHRDRNHGALHFINLRDRYGLTQVVVDDDASPELQKAASALKLEYCIAVRGIVRKRPDEMVNHDMPTGEECKVPFLQCFGGTDKKAWRSIATIIFDSLDAVAGKLTFTIKLGGNVEKGTYTITEGTPTFTAAQG